LNSKYTLSEINIGLYLYDSVFFSNEDMLWMLIFNVNIQHNVYQLIG